MRDRLAADGQPVSGRAVSDPPPPRVHGGVDPLELVALGIRESDVIDCSVSVNPYGATPAVAAAIRTAPLERYPDPRASAARSALARMVGRPASEVVFGNGAADLLWSLARVLVREGTRILIPKPTFAEFGAAAVGAGGRVVSVRVEDRRAVTAPTDERGGTVELPDLATTERMVHEQRPEVVYLCTPNNPGGDALRADAIGSLAARHPGVLFVVDEAFLSLSEHWADATVPLPLNTVRVRSLTKEHAIPGVRAGYALLSEGLAARLEAARPAWTTSAMAQAAVATCEATDYVAESRRRLLEGCGRLRDALLAIGSSPRPTSTFFFLLPVGDAAAFRRRLLIRHQVLVRDCSSFGLPSHVRIAARTPEENARVLSALAAELRNLG